MLQQDKARAKLLEAQAVRLEVLEVSPQEWLIRRDLGRGYYNLANNELTAADHELQEEAIRGRWGRCAADLSKAVEAYEKLPSDQLDLDVRLEHARCLRLRADAFFSLGELKGAAADYLQAEKLLRRLTSRNPTVYRFRIVLAETLFNQCMFQFTAGENEEAAAALGRCRATLMQALRIDPSNAAAADQLLSFTTTITAALIDGDQPNFEMAGRLSREALAEMQELISESEEFQRFQAYLEKLKELVEATELKQSADQESESVT